MTPLLDWTESPFVALYFAFLKEASDDNPFRTVYALDAKATWHISLMIDGKYQQQKDTPEGYEEHPLSSAYAQLLRTFGIGEVKGDKLVVRKSPPDTVKIVRPSSDDNRNLVSQRGLFTKGPDHSTLDNWVKANPVDLFPVVLRIIRIANVGREECLKYLNLMNINHLSLFPDLRGASEFCNMSLRIEGY